GWWNLVTNFRCGCSTRRATFSRPTPVTENIKPEWPRRSRRERNGKKAQGITRAELASIGGAPRRDAEHLARRGGASADYRAAGELRRDAAEPSPRRGEPHHPPRPGGHHHSGSAGSRLRGPRRSPERRARRSACAASGTGGKAWPAGNLAFRRHLL